MLVVPEEVVIPEEVKEKAISDVVVADSETVEVAQEDTKNE